jgi:glucose/arabinose dehydrogenase
MRQSVVALTLGAGALALLAPGLSGAESNNLRIGPAAYSDWKADAPGAWRKIAPGDMPAPLASEPKAERSQIAPQPDGAAPRTLDGFKVETFAQGLTGPRVLRFAPNGDLFVAESSAGRVRAFRLVDGALKPSRSALHGSWNRAKRTGYKVIRLKFKDGRPTGEYQDLLTGFVIDDAHVWGRPVDVVVASDGSLLVSEDANGTIYRVSRDAH